MKLHPITERGPWRMCGIGLYWGWRNKHYSVTIVANRFINSQSSITIRTIIYISQGFFKHWEGVYKYSHSQTLETMYKYPKGCIIA